MSKKLNGGNFGMTIGSNELVAVYFWAKWCVPCERYADIYELACDEVLPGSVVMGKFDVDESKDVAISAGVKDIPCIQIYSSGVKKSELIGINSKDDILAFINEYI